MKPGRATESLRVAWDTEPAPVSKQPGGMIRPLVWNSTTLFLEVILFIFFLIFVFKLCVARGCVVCAYRCSGSPQALDSPELE